MPIQAPLDTYCSTFDPSTRQYLTQQGFTVELPWAVELPCTPTTAMEEENFEIPLSHYDLRILEHEDLPDNT